MYVVVYNMMKIFYAFYNFSAQCIDEILLEFVCSVQYAIRFVHTSTYAAYSNRSETSLLEYT